MSQSRRAFLAHTGAIGAAFCGLRNSGAAGTRSPRLDELLGPLHPDPGGLIDLPEGFKARIVSTAGEEMDDGLLLPGAPDGMAAFPTAKEGIVAVVRNHELTSGIGGAFGPGNRRLGKLAPERVYDMGFGKTPGRGGTSTFIYDVNSGTRIKEFMSLAGTVRNCAGGPTPWGSWITCEEAVNLPDKEHEEPHGYTFEVPSDAIELVEPVALKAMGRFNHEAIAIDPNSGVVYETEDRPDSLLYRFIPDHPGTLAEGGKLQALSIRGGPSADTRNWNRFTSFPIGEALEVSWVDLDDIQAPKDDLRYRGFLKGAARFGRGEGMWTDSNGAIWFTCTAGGPNFAGQVFRYVPSPNEGSSREMSQRGTLELFFEPNHRMLVDMCDNLTIAPWGDVILCEDGGGSDRLLGLTPKGDLYPIARNASSDAEFAGATFSPDGSTLFVNMQGEGLTLAILGPWPEGGKG